MRNVVCIARRMSVLPNLTLLALPPVLPVISRPLKWQVRSPGQAWPSRNGSRVCSPVGGLSHRRCSRHFRRASALCPQDVSAFQRSRRRGCLHACRLSGGSGRVCRRRCRQGHAEGAAPVGQQDITQGRGAHCFCGQEKQAGDGGEAPVAATRESKKRGQNCA